MREFDPETAHKRTVAHEVGCDLSAISLDELRERVVILEREIARIRAEEGRKLASREAAGSVFKL